MMPELSLAYSSQAENGFVGLGWFLTGLPSIGRCPRTFAQDNVHGSLNFDANDRFCMDGQRLIGTSGTYGADGSEYRTEIESYSKIVSHGSTGSGPTSFTVWTKSGQILEFGSTTDSRVLTVGLSTASVRVWAVSKVSDVMGNYLTVTYNCTEVSSACTDATRTTYGQVYPLRIDYTGHSSTGVTVAPYNSVRFVYTSRSDTAPMYQAGALTQTTVLLTNIKTYQDSNLVLDYRLTYRAGTSTLRSRLTSVKLCDGSGACPFPETTFEWQGGSGVFATSNITNPTGSRTYGYPLVAGQFDGDGITDVALADTTPYCTDFPIYNWNGSGFTLSSTTMPNPAGGSGADECYRLSSPQTMLAPNGLSFTAFWVRADFCTTCTPPLSPYSLSYMAVPIGAFNQAQQELTDIYPPAPSAAGDYNGDGYVDILFQAYYMFKPSFNILKGDGDSNWTTVFESRSGALGGAGDFDGDGCTDYIDGSVLKYSPLCNSAVATSSLPSASGYSSVMGDYNGDGKMDYLLISSSGGAAKLWLSTGTGFTLVNSSVSGSAGWGYTDSVYVGDWNADGKTDLAISPSTGSTLFVLSTGTDFTPALDGMENPLAVPTAGVPATIADWNSDGASDIWFQAPLSGSDELYLMSFMPELMTSASNGIGSTTNITYDRLNKGGSFYNKGAAQNYPTQVTDGAFYVVKRIDASNGLGTCTPSVSYANCYSTTYSYQGAHLNLTGRGNLGFSQVVITDLQTSIVQTTNYCTLFPLTGLVASQTKVHASVTLSSVANRYNGTTGCGASATSGVNVVNLTRSDVSGRDLNNAVLPSTETTYTYDSYGNELTINVSVSDGSSKSTTNTYWNDTTNWFLGRMLTTSVRKIVGSSDLTRNSSFCYDAGSGLLIREVIEPGSLTCSGGSPGSHTLITEYAYDDFGHRETTTVSGPDIDTRTSSVVYDSKGQFQLSATNALSQEQSWTYEPKFGNPITHDDLNDLRAEWDYDAFGRVILEEKPDGTKMAMSYVYCGSCPTNGKFYARTQFFASDGTTQIGPTGTIYYDMLSRVIASDVQGFAGGDIRTSTIFNSDGQVGQSSRPYFVSGGTPAWTSFDHDALGRVIEADFPDGSETTYGYDGLTTIVTNDLGQTTTTIKNAQGLNATVTDAYSKSTNYIYDAFDNLLTVTDPAGNVITNEYNIRGDKTESSDPDLGTWTYTYNVLGLLTGQIDAKSQSTSLTYDLLNRATVRDESGLYSTWTYGSSVANHNVGLLTQAKACTASACSTTISDRTFAYDALARPDTSTQVAGGVTATYITAYNTTNGRIQTVTFPSGLVQKSLYNSYGYLCRLTDNSGSHTCSSTADSHVLYTVNTRDAELHLTRATAGNGVITDQTFDPDTGLIATQRAGTSGAIASFDYTFDVIGNLRVRADNNQSYTERFCYDNLNRLTNYAIAASCTGSSTKTVAYNDIGNITSKSDSGSYGYPSAGTARPHAVSSITGTVDGVTNPLYAYDANGNLSCVSTGSSCTGTISRQVSVTAFNMADTVTQGATSIAFKYDDGHARISQASTVSGVTTTTLYVNDPASGAMSERVTVGAGSPSWTDYLVLDGKIVGQRTSEPIAPLWGSAVWGSFNWTASSSGSWTFFNLDHLGSIAIIADAAGNVVQRLTYDAWGKRRNANGTDAACGAITSPVTRGFTNQEQLPAQCVVNLNARLYDASIGKFLSPDSIVPEPFDGQSYNRYAYVNNRPLSLVDPSGNETVTVTGTRPPPPTTNGGGSPVIVKPGLGDVGPSLPGDLDGEKLTLPMAVQQRQIPLAQLSTDTKFVVAPASAHIRRGFPGSRINYDKIAKRGVANEYAKGTNGGFQQVAQNTAPCAFFCSLLGGPVDIKDASGNVIGTYNHQMFSAGMQATGAAAGAMDAAAATIIGGTTLPVLADALGPAGSVFGRAKLGGSSIGDINANNSLRIGWGWSGTQAEGTNVFRLSGNWVDSLMGAKNSHIDLFTWGGK